MNRKVLEAFTGKSTETPIAINVRFGETVKKIYVGFAEIRIPFETKAKADVETLEKEHDCRIKRVGNGWLVVPNVVSEIIEKDGAICSACDEHIRALEEWMDEHSGVVIKALLGL